MASTSASRASDATRKKGNHPGYKRRCRGTQSSVELEDAFKQRLRLAPNSRRLTVGHRLIESLIFLDAPALLLRVDNGRRFRCARPEHEALNKTLVGLCQYGCFPI